MRVAHIIITHKNYSQVARLIQTMQHPQSDFYIHSDARVPAAELDNLKDLQNTFLIRKRIKCNWGGYSLTKAIFNSISEVLATGIAYDYINLLSGQDYPISPPEQFHNFLTQQNGKNFIAYDESQESEWWRKAAGRYEKYHFTDYKFKGKFLLEKIVNKIAPGRKFPGYTTLYGGNTSTWWTISRECAIYLNKTFNSSSQLPKFLRFCWGTDEFVITTIIMNSPFKEHTINNNLRYIDWSEGKDSPKLFDLSDYEKIKNSKKMLARKFDINYDRHILNKIDQQLLTNNN